jgi:predicted GIY-YIG superfamily endonuclease
VSCKSNPIKIQHYWLRNRPILKTYFYSNEGLSIFRKNLLKGPGSLPGILTHGKNGKNLLFKDDLAFWVADILGIENAFPGWVPRRRIPMKFVPDTTIVGNALRFKTVKRWIRTSKLYYMEVIKRRRYLHKQCTSHMEFGLQSIKIYVVYEYKFSDGTSYVGISSNLKKRKHRHDIFGPVMESVKRGNTYEFSMLHDSLRKPEAQKLERETIALRKSEGISLNISDGGDVGFQGGIKYSDVLRVAKGCTGLTDLDNKHSSHYQAMHRNGWNKDIMKALGWKHHKAFIWSQEAIQLEFKKCRTLNEVRTHHKGAYDAAKRIHKIDEYCKKYGIIQRIKWYRSKCRTEAMKYPSSGSWAAGSRSSYAVAIHQGWFRAICIEVYGVEPRKRRSPVTNALELI